MNVPKPPPEVLRQADYAELVHRPTSEEAQQLAEGLLAITLNAEEAHQPRKRRRSQSAIRSLRSTMAALTHDLLDASLNVAADGYCFRPERIPHFTLTEATFDQYMALRDVWQAEDLMDRVDGAWFVTTFDKGEYLETEGRRAGWSPRLRATPKLIAIAACHGITPETLDDHFTAALDLTYPVTLTTKQKEDGSGKEWNKKVPSRRVPFEHTEESDRLAQQVRDLNAFLEAQTFDPPIRPRFLCRFSEDPRRKGQLVWGGRLYATGRDSYQSWDKDRRLGLKINGLPVAEIDIKASHLTIYLARLGVHLPQGADPYIIRGISRDVVKGLVTAFFGRGDLEQNRWPRKLREDYKATRNRDIADDYKLKDVKAAILDAIPLLQRLPDSDLGWGELQKIEAGILLGVIDPLRWLAGVPILTVHDSLIVPEPDVDHVAWALSTRFEGVTGTYPTLMIHREGQEAVRWIGSKGK